MIRQKWDKKDNKNEEQTATAWGQNRTHPRGPSGPRGWDGSAGSGAGFFLAGLFRSIQHTGDGNTISFGGIIDHNVGHRAYDPTILQNGGTGHE